MYAKNCTIEQLEKALASVNAKYNGNIRFKNIEPKGKRFMFTLTVNSSKEAGHRIGYAHPWTNKDGSEYKPKRLAAACWHVHGDFFDSLLKIAPEAVITTGSRMVDGSKMEITKDGGNWQDWNAGSQMYPQMMSELCECEA